MNRKSVRLARQVLIYICVLSSHTFISVYYLLEGLLLRSYNSFNYNELFGRKGMVFDLLN